MTDDPIWNEAWRRESSHHAGHRDFRPHIRAKGANLIGLRGEQAFAERFGLSVDLSTKKGGDGGVDFRLPVRLGSGERYVAKINCKTALKPRDLIVEVNKCVRTTIYVLCGYHAAGDCAHVIGWQWGAALMTSEPKYYGYGVLNYWWPAGDLRDIDELEQRATK